VGEPLRGRTEREVGMQKLWLAAVVVAFLVPALFWLECHRRYALQDAEVQASLHLLAEFHRGYLAGKGVPLEDYRKELAAFERKHSGLDHLGMYAKNAGAE
jgi:hypothetical protein